MSRNVRCVPVDFDWPLNKTWDGFLKPERLHEQKCPACTGTGYSPAGQRLHNLWYGNLPFRPEDNGSTPLTASTSAVRALAEYHIADAPEFYGRGEAAIVREATRLADLWNGQWSHHLNQADVDALVAAGRLMDLTHTYTTEDGWQPRDPFVVPPAEQVNEWSMSGFGHDSIKAADVGTAARFIEAGWAPTFVDSGGGLQSGVDYVGSGQ